MVLQPVNDLSIHQLVSQTCISDRRIKPVVTNQNSWVKLHSTPGPCIRPRYDVHFVRACLVCPGSAEVGTCPWTVKLRPRLQLTRKAIVCVRSGVHWTIPQRRKTLSQTPFFLSHSIPRATFSHHGFALMCGNWRQQYHVPHQVVCTDLKPRDQLWRSRNHGARSERIGSVRIKENRSINWPIASQVSKYARCEIEDRSRCSLWLYFKRVDALSWSATNEYVGPLDIDSTRY